VGFAVQELELRVLGLEFRAQGCLVYRVNILRIKGLGFRV
jgi:hypothetical protein